jgi:hypothetical protein
MSNYRKRSMDHDTGRLCLTFICGGEGKDLNNKNKKVGLSIKDRSA